jgi:hypothetical protein
MDKRRSVPLQRHTIRMKPPCTRDSTPMAKNCPVRPDALARLRMRSWRLEGRSARSCPSYMQALASPREDRVSVWHAGTFFLFAGLRNRHSLMGAPEPSHGAITQVTRT